LSERRNCVIQLTHTRQLSCPRTRTLATSVAPSDLPPRPSRSLAGKVAIVTGAGSRGTGLGNGRAISLLLAEDGCSVVCGDLNASWAEKTAEMINTSSAPSHPAGPKPGQAVAVAADVTLDADCAALAAAAVARFGRLDILVNVVGVLGPRGTAVDVDAAQWARGLETNVTSSMRLRAFPVAPRDKL